MIKCIHILPMNKLSGAEKVALLICENSNKYKPLVICGGEQLRSVFEKKGIEAYAFNFSNKNIFKTIREIKNLITKNNIKILHAHDNKASINAYLIKSIYNMDIHVISHVHSCYPFLEKNTIKKSIESFFRKRYDYNIICGNEVYKFYKKNSKSLIEEKTAILSNSINVEEIQNINTRDVNLHKEKLGIKKNDIVFGFVGRICEIKGIIPLINEISKNAKKLKKCKILIVGSGDQENEVKELIRKNNLDDIFINMGFREDVYQIYPLIDIFILPSIYEGLPMVLLEAMAFKNAIISMNVGGIHELIKNNNTGVLIPEKNYEQFVNMMITLKNDNNLRKKLSEAGYKYVSEEYDIKNYINKLNRIYNQILG